MAEKYYSLEETTKKLNKTEAEIRELVKSGELNALEDGGELLFNAEQIDKKVESKAERPIEIEPVESGDTTKLEEPSVKEKGEKSEEEVKLDTSGLELGTEAGGTGLLDASLAPGDTALGDVLDEIYTEAGPGETPGTSGVLEVAKEEVFKEEAVPLPAEAPMPEIPARRIVQELPPDMMSNAFGLVLFLPLMASIYMAIAAVAGFMGFTPGIVTMTQNIMWPHVMSGSVVLMALILGIPFYLQRRSLKPKIKAKKKVPKKPT